MKNNKKAQKLQPVLAIAAISIATAFGGGNSSVAGDFKSGAAPSPAPGWELPDLAGHTLHSTDFQGKVVVLDFWATWCPPCREEIPGFIELQIKYQEQGLAVVGVSVDQAGADTVKTFAKKMGINYPVVLADAKIPNLYDINVLPTTFILDRTGRVVKQYLGMTPESEIESKIKPLLKL